ncbi:MAG: helix-turn-helix transcriptional regulator, partial [Candidatus Omnitrophica bacterium]|nr:helix-turn-helix transcriptional regulator [Candidatus Omnitrophota bacterium]
MISKNIRKLRKEKGFSQEKLARAADISLNTLTKLESG